MRSRILIVDDEAVITMQLEERLTAMGYAVAGMVANGEAAVAKAREAMPDLVLMDIVMPGRMNGIEAAGIITDELGIPVVFVTSYADDTIIEKARRVRPYGYIVKPFSEREIKAAIEVALFKKAAEKPVERERPAGGEAEPEGSAYLDFPNVRTMLLEDIFSDFILFLYMDPASREPLFKFALEEGIRKGGKTIYAYFSSTLQRHFLKEIQAEQLYTRRLKGDDLPALVPVIDKCLDSLPGAGGEAALRVLFDFAECSEFEDVLAVKNRLLEKKKSGAPVAGILAADIGNMNHAHIATLAEGIPKIIVSNGRDMTLSFAHHTFPADSVAVVPQETIDDVVKKSLEPVVLSFLDKPLSGFDLVHEIHNRYRVLIPQARVYAILHDLERDGYLELRMSGKSKLYCPTEKGRAYISRRLENYKQVFRHILGGDTVK
jgi:CheY-like chemotaxis protein